MSESLVGPFADGAAFTGRLTYDLAAIDTGSDESYGRYSSSLNGFTFTSGGQTIRGVPDHNGEPVGAYVSNYSYAETFAVVAHDVSLPDGWSINHSSTSDGYAVLFQNAPSRRVLGSDDLPTSLNLSDWVNTRQMRLDFWGDSTWPTGSFSGRMTVFGSVNSLTRVSPSAVSESSSLAALFGMGAVWLAGVLRRRCRQAAQLH